MKSFEPFKHQISEINNQILELLNKFPKGKDYNSEYFIRFEYKDKYIDVKSISDFSVTPMGSIGGIKS